MTSRANPNRALLRDAASLVALQWSWIAPAFLASIRHVGWSLAFLFLARGVAGFAHEHGGWSVILRLGSLTIYVFGLRHLLLAGLACGRLLAIGVTMKRAVWDVLREPMPAPRAHQPALSSLPARPAEPPRPRLAAGPTCWICGGSNDGHQH